MNAMQLPQVQPQVRSTPVAPASRDARVPAAVGAPASLSPRARGRHEDEEPEVLVFVLRYDDELAYLKNEGVVRTGMLPSGFKVR